MIKLSPRLSAAACLVHPGRKTVDIGTDHGYLPAYLVENSVTHSVIAADIGKGPLENAAKTLERYGLEDKIGLRLSDGLKNISPDEAQEIIICGMGGTLIEDILTAAPWIKRDGTHLVLQPMTHIENVRKYICENGFETEKETVVFDEGRYYLTISAFYTGNNTEKEIGWQYFSDGLAGIKDGDKITEKQYKRVVTRLEALKSAQRFPEEQAQLESVLDYYERTVKK